MVGGRVIEVAEIKSRPDALFIDCRDTKYKDTCAILVKKDELSLKIELGDHIWWHGRIAYWTPQAFKLKKKRGIGGRDYDIKLERIGYSGVAHPDRKREFSND